MTIETMTDPQSKPSQRSLWAMLALGFVLRLIFVVLAPVNISGGDTGYLLTIGHDLLNGSLQNSPATGPIYLMFSGVVQLFFSNDSAITIIRLLNCLMGTALCFFVYILGNRYFSRRVGLIATLLVAINPIFIIEASNVLTESVFLFFLFAGLAMYAARQDSNRTGVFVAMGVLLGLTTLTRAVALLLPVVVVIHMAYSHRTTALRLIGALLLSYVLVVATWSIYSTLRWGQFVIGAQGLAANVYLGTTSWCGPECVDQQAGITTDSTNNQNKFVQSAFDTIRADPVGYIRHRLSNVVDSELQPYNTTFFPGESIKTITSNWWARGHAFGELSQFFQSDNFWPKLALYIFHYMALLAGALGLIISVRQLGTRLVLYGMLGYFLVVHMVLTAIPRYLFPIEPLWILFAAFSLSALWRQPTTLNQLKGVVGIKRASQVQP